MANNDSLKDKLAGWADKANEYADDIRDKTNEYADKLGQITSKLGQKSNESADAIPGQQQVRPASEQVKQFVTHAQEKVRDIQNEASRLKNRPGADSENIQRRADRFEDGVETVAGELQKQQAGTQPSHDHQTAPINSKGNYTTSNGSQNNYIDRLDVHAEETKKRMREDASENK